MFLANLHGVGVITKLYFVILAAFKELATLNQKPVYDFIHAVNNNSRSIYLLWKSYTKYKKQKKVQKGAKC